MAVRNSADLTFVKHTQASVSLTICRCKSSRSPSSAPAKKGLSVGFDLRSPGTAVSQPDSEPAKLALSLVQGKQDMTLECANHCMLRTHSSVSVHLSLSILHHPPLLGFPTSEESSYRTHPNRSNKFESRLRLIRQVADRPHQFGTHTLSLHLVHRILTVSCHRARFS